MADPTPPPIPVDPIPVTIAGQPPKWGAIFHGLATLVLALSLIVVRLNGYTVISPGGTPPAPTTPAPSVPAPIPAPAPGTGGAIPAPAPPTPGAPAAPAPPTPGAPPGVFGGTATPAPPNAWLLTTLPDGRTARVWGHAVGDAIEWDENDLRNLYITAP